MFLCFFRTLHFYATFQNWNCWRWSKLKNNFHSIKEHKITFSKNCYATKLNLEQISPDYRLTIWSWNCKTSFLRHQFPGPIQSPEGIICNFGLLAKLEYQDNKSLCPPLAFPTIYNFSFQQRWQIIAINQRFLW